MFFFTPDSQLIIDFNVFDVNNFTSFEIIHNKNAFQ